jgi:malonate transporter and related proteins
VLVGVGFALARWGGWPLFRLMSEFASSPRVDAKLLLAYFGGCLIVYVLARIIAWLLFRMDGTAQTIFAMGDIFSNNVLLGVPLAKITLDDVALPAVSLVLVFNSLLLSCMVLTTVATATTPLVLALIGRVPP